MNEEVLKLYKENINLFSFDKKSWTPQQIRICYEIYNKLTGQNKSDSGCPSCRRTVINAVKLNYKKIKELI